jgi:hypothetical protein
MAPVFHRTRDECNKLADVVEAKGDYDAALVGRPHSAIHIVYRSLDNTWSTKDEEQAKH